MNAPSTNVPINATLEQTTEMRKPVPFERRVELFAEEAAKRPTHLHQAVRYLEGIRQAMQQNRPVPRIAGREVLQMMNPAVLAEVDHLIGLDSKAAEAWLKEDVNARPFQGVSLDAVTLVQAELQKAAAIGARRQEQRELLEEQTAPHRNKKVRAYWDTPGEKEA